MYRSSQLIAEIKKRRVLWDTAYQHYSDKDIRAIQWFDVGEALISDWRRLNHSERNERVQDIKRRWKNIRDYYKKGNKNFTGRKYIYQDLLTFLDDRSLANSFPCSIKTAEMDISSITIPKDEETFDCEVTDFTEHESIAEMPVEDVILPEESSISQEVTTPLNENEASKSTGLLHEVPDNEEHNFTPLKRKRLSSASGFDADKYFLLSLLPEVRQLSGLKKMDFKMSVMRELKTALYNQQYFVIKQENEHE